VYGGPLAGHGFQIAGGSHDEHDNSSVPARGDDSLAARGGLIPSPLHRARHTLYAYQLRRWFTWSESNDLDPLIGIQRAHIELYIRDLGESGLQVSSVNTMMHGVRGFFRFAHIDGLIPANPAVYARLPKIHTDESRTQGLDLLELIRFLQVAQTLTVHHGALAYLLGINALRASEAAAVRIEDYQETLRGHRVLCTWSAKVASPPRCR
jgi:site-specific recombinase XerD